MQVQKTELFASPDKHAAYAVDLITRLVKRLDHEDRTPEALKDIIGDDLWDEVCHAIGWDIDWDEVHNNRNA